MSGDRHNAMFICVGASAWSEELPDTTFTGWFTNNFGAGVDAWPWGLPLNIDQRTSQQDEYVTAVGFRPGIDPLCKPLSALDCDARQALHTEQPSGSGVIKLSIRQVPWLSDTGADHVDANKARFWKVRLISGDFQTPPVMRSHKQRTPCTSDALFGRFSDVASARRITLDIMTTLGNVEHSLVQLTQNRANRGSTRDALSKIKFLRALLLTVVFESENPPVNDRKSTCLNFAAPGRGLRMLHSPAAVVATKCLCSKLARFPTWLHYECSGSGSFLVTPNTKFGAESELIPAVMHSMKCELLSHIRCHPVSPKNILRGVISETNADVLRIASNATAFSSVGTTPENIDHGATDKHKIIWLVATPFARCLTRVLRRDGGKGKRKGQTTDKDNTWRSTTSENTGNALETDLTALFDALVNTSECFGSGVHRLWEYGSLHIATSAPKSQVGRWKLRFSPPMLGPHFGDFICIIMDWVGNYFFYHECLRKAATTALHAGPLVKMFVPHVTARTTNALCGLLSEDVLALYEQKMGFKFDSHQRKALHHMNAATDTAFFVRALAGVGKTAVSAVIQFACTKRYMEDHADSCVVVLFPSRELREDLVQEALAQAAIPQEKLMWLGRPSRPTSTLPMWDQHVAKLFKCRLESSGVLLKLQKLQSELVAVLAEMKASVAEIISDPKWSCSWNFMKAFLRGGPVTNVHLDDYLQKSSIAKLKAQTYLIAEVSDVINNYGQVMAEVAESVTVVLSTCDAWCKLQAQQSSGISKIAASQKKVKVLIMDEAQSYTLPAVLAACHMAETVVFFGDENQSIDVVQPNYTRTPWVSFEDPLSTCANELDITVDSDVADDEMRPHKIQRTGAGRMHGGSSGSGEPSSSSSIQIRTGDFQRMNPRRRFFT